MDSESMKVIIADQINEKGIKNLEEVADVVVDFSITQEELISKIKDFDAIIVRSRTKVTRAVIEAGEKLKIIARAGVGVDNVDVKAATERGVMVVNAPESASITVAELTIGLILALTRKISIADKSVKEGKWEKSKFIGIELNGKTLGIIGLGRIGTHVLVKAKAFGMSILVNDPYITKEAAKELGVEIVDLQTLLKKSDIMTIHVPLTPETKYLISKDEFKMMKENAIIVNAARGGIINEDDLYEALTIDKLGGAALDVFEKEPPELSPLLTLDNVILTPHIGASTKEAQIDAAVRVANEVKTVFEGGTPKNVINMPVLDKETLQKVKPHFKVAEKLGNFLIQTAKGNIRKVDITYCGDLAEFPKQDIITRFLLKEILDPILTEPVNLINAHSVAKNRGIIITEGKRSDAKGHKNLIKVGMRDDETEMIIEGTFNEEPRIVKINDYKLNIKPKGNMLIVKYKDLPGTIGTIGKKLGEHNINIATMQVGRKDLGGEAVMILKVDQNVLIDIVEEVKRLKHVYDVIPIKL